MRHFPLQGALHKAVAVALVAATSAPGAARGQVHDPRLSWRTLESPHFQIHFHEGEEALARRVAGAAERAHDLLSPLLRHRPAGRTQLVLSDDADDANGSATPVPYNTVRLLAVPPTSLSELDDSTDWVWSLTAHEYTHILHLDTVEGVPAALNSIFGKLWVPNALVPPWLVEGMAVLHEDVRGHGRNASALFDMYARSMATEGGALSLPVTSNQPLEWPLGHAWYLLGGRFLDWLDQGHGRGALADFTHDQGGWVWPFAVGLVAERHFGGKDFRRLWAEFASDLESRSRAQLAEVRRRPVTRAAPLTRRGGRIAHPRWSPDGAFVAYFERGLDERPGIRRVAPDGRDLGRAADVEGNGTLALDGSGRAVVAISDVHREYRVHDDLYLLDLETGERRRITYGERATDPDFWPGGGTVVYLARPAPGEMALRRLRLDGGAPETLWQRPGAQLDLPRVSPDGRRIAFGLKEGGRRDIAVWENGQVDKVTDDDAVDVSPSWGPDGRLYFASDRSGVYNVYAREDGGLRQVTNVESGAFEPQVSPDGRTLVFVGYSRAGYDLVRTPLDPAGWLDAPPAPPRPGGVDYPRAPDFPVHDYRPLSTLGPAFWLPVVSSDAAGAAFGILGAGRDVVGLHAWAAEILYGPRARDVDYAAAYLGSWAFPSLLLASSRFLDFAPDGSGRRSSEWTPLEVQLVFPSSHLDRAFAVTAGWRGTRYDVLGPAPAGPLAFRDGFRSEVSLQLAYTDLRRFTRSVSAEEGRALALRLAYAASEVGSDFGYALAKASATQFLRVPPFRHVALAIHLAGGAAVEAFPGTVPFTLGGIPSPDLAGLLLASAGLGGFSSLPDQLRGYPAGLLGGTRLLSGTAELRTPILSPELGWSTWPLFLRRVSGAVFLDAGAAWTPRQDPAAPPQPRWHERLRFGTGAELVLELVLGYYLRVDVRLGVARGLGRLLAHPRPPDPFAETQLYLALGQSF